ncbi:MAG: 50S ribosomal protein L16 [Candidatus Marinimicrobia bacterium]|jgi:large subunit ribosomal protein L16|nr:50S ribosomal protein L16 [Candidatus Neomarinimicrobiota bacterium]MAV92913.1 50S ribosomal protein L16 [Candidatus Neomarinimicrobiota bacterium]|tara:strand:+ start:19806 stop:20219 length:414 start_codon:yes stop_codon:yes gene_type:complete
MLSPKRIKYRKPHKGNLKGMSNSGNYVCYGTYGMKALEAGWITNRQIEAGRISLSRRVRKIGRLWIRIFPNKSITKKPAETRMGKGKGSPDSWVSIIKPGRILYEVDGLTEEQAKEAFRACSHKFSIKTKMVSRREL